MDYTHLLRLLVIVLVAADVVRAAVAYPVGGDVDPVGPVDLSRRRGVPVGGGSGVGRGVGAVAGAEQLVRLGLELLGMRRLLPHEGSLKKMTERKISGKPSSFSTREPPAFSV